MKKIFYTKVMLITLLFFSVVSCVDPYQLQTNSFEDLIVIEATITNELKHQEIKVSRTFPLEEGSEPEIVTNAEVYVTDNNGSQYDFEYQNGKYVSTSEFEASPNKEYILTVNVNGKTYQSIPQLLTTINPIISVVPQDFTNVDGERGVQINVNSFDPTNTSKYYRYEYEETSKVTAPMWNPFNTILVDQPRICPGFGTPGFQSIALEPRVGETKTCYTTKESIDINLTSTNLLTEDRVSNFQVRFIGINDYTIAERYTILVKQYVLTLEAYTYYKTLKEMSGSGDVLSQNQPGFLYGNIKCTSNPSEKVVGRFDVSSISTKRIFFNFDEIFPTDPLPDYFVPCIPIPFDSEDFGTPDPRPNAEYPCGNGGAGLALRAHIRNKTRLYLDNTGPFYSMVFPYCGDCTSFSSNIIPSFWID